MAEDMDMLHRCPFQLRPITVPAITTEVMAVITIVAMTGMEEVTTEATITVTAMAEVMDTVDKNK